MSKLTCSMDRLGNSKKEVIKIEVNKIINAECKEYMKTLPNECVDLVIFDPPYFEIVDSDWDNQWQDKAEYIEFIKECILEGKRILKPTGTMYLWGAIGVNKGFALLDIVKWIHENKVLDIVNWITQRNTRIRATYKGFPQAREELIMCVKDRNKFIWNPAYTEIKNTRKDLQCNGKPRKNEFKRATDVWCDLAEASQSSKERFYYKNGERFKTVKSLKICDRIINASSNERDIVFIGFTGSGSEIVSCIKNNRNYLATEKSKRTIDEIIKPRIVEVLHE
ncbi:DNA-methyltransferase [Clostridium weizhouense]|uniref:Site-specific DNA-methyltransferase n=1 Tax=Clostridium weizhouense TaxID=2859781 RepID=A0ABS7AK97_9CLOT|nr:site-specific DNA-methyltransferase [Clostridium weizhouense]MBW6408994.1 site-specific DNA-methyltransferase [Clostridium weizhouense]